MPTRDLNIQTTGAGTFFGKIKLPPGPLHLSRWEVFWADLPRGSTFQLWTQPGPTPLAASDAGANLIANFTLPLIGDKASSFNVETVCLDIPQGHDFAHAKFINTSGSAAPIPIHMVFE